MYEKEGEEGNEMKEVKKRKLLVGVIWREVPLTEELGVDTVEGREGVCLLV